MHAPGDSIPFALSNVDQRLYEPRAVPLGKNCGCICPGCRQPVYAKHCMSGKRVPHFAHAPGSDCATGFETALHLAAKQMIEERGVLAFPELVASIKIIDDTGHIHKPEKQLVAGGRRALSKVVLEQTLGQIRPDVRVDAEGLGAVLVEVAVTHFVDERKLDQIERGGIAAIEIDLSTLRDATFAALEVALFDNPTGIRWLYHPEMDKAKQALQTSIQWLLDAATASAAAWARMQAERDEADRVVQAARREAEAEQEAARRQQEAERKAVQRQQEAEQKRVTDQALRRQRNEELKKAAVFKARPEDQKRQILLRRLGRAQLPAILAANVRGATSFGVKDTLLWQVTLFGGLVHEQAAKGNGWVARNYVRAWMRHRFSIPPVREKDANDAIDDYLMALAAGGALIACNNNSYAITVADLTCFETLTAIRNDRNFDPTRLRWTPKDEWPSQMQAWVVAEAMTPNVHAAGRWFKLASEMHRNIGFPPIEICQWASQTGGTKEAVANYNIVTGAYNLIFGGLPRMPTIDTFGYSDSAFYTSALAPNHPLYDATDPDLSAFKKAGGKLILWHGWADQHISPMYTIQYYEAMQNQMGSGTVEEFARMYLVPGVGHCGGGEGMANIDLVSKITGWVEQATAPTAAMTYKTDSVGNQTASRPVYPYPAVAQFTGSGDWHDGANYVSAVPRYNVRTPSWPGSFLYTPYAPKLQGVAAP